MSLVRCAYDSCPCLPCICPCLPGSWDAILANAIYFKGLWTHAFKKE